MSQDIVSPYLSANLKLLREKAGISQEELAKRIKVSQGYIAMLEREKRGNISTRVLIEMANALETSIDSLLLADLTQDQVAA